ncbi:hypothetical protein MLD38_033386 [Melastoma candidum]|uniref:Uncharacterized protein n=1 Tax=Melastoma candidum TaxID=119954 RepID=A0ACB9M754_9MYRT|nr:hypothetical protein MLD38_033386 [Melastoma candidum]
MVRFSCFNSHLTGHKSKKAAASSAENEVSSTSQNQDRNLTSLKDSSLIERGWKSDDIMKRMDAGQIRWLKKSQSLESGLENKENQLLTIWITRLMGQFLDEIVAKNKTDDNGGECTQSSICRGANPEAANFLNWRTAYI